MALGINALFFLSLSKLNSLSGSLWCNGFSIQFQNIFFPAFSPPQPCPPPAHIIFLHVTSLFPPSKWTIEIYGNDFHKQFDVKLPLSFKRVSPTVFPGNWNNLGITLYFSVHKGADRISSCLHFPCLKTPRAQSQWHWYLLLTLTWLLQRAPGNSSVSRVWGVNINRTTVKRIASGGLSSIPIISNPPCGISHKTVQDVLQHQVLSF